MKKVFSIVLTVLMLISTFLTIPVMAKTNVELKLTDATVYAGDEFELKLFISDNSKLSGAVIDINYDSDFVEFVSAEKGAILDDSASVSIKNFENKSYVRFTYMAPSSSVTSEGILFSVKFKALENTDGQSVVKVSIPSAGDFVNSDLEKLSYSVKNSTLKIINTSLDEVDTTVDEPVVENDSSTTESATGTTAEITTEENQNSSNNDGNDNLKLAIGLFVAGGIIIIGVVIYLIVSKKKRGN